MLIKIDNRENIVYDSCLKLLNEIQMKPNINTNIEIIKEQLNIGDIILFDDKNEPILIFERKTLNDLASSICDGRYKEQSYRLNETNVSNHNIVYLIEGNLENYKQKFNRIDKSALYSSIVSLHCFKGFSVLRSNSINETAEYILRFALKIQKEGVNKLFNLNKKIDNCDDINNNINKCDETKTNNIVDSNKLEYTDVITTKKKNYVNESNIHIIWLMQISNVSNNIAKVIIDRYETIWNLRETLNNDNNCLNNIKLVTQTGKQRSIGKNVIENIKKFIL